MLSNEIANGIVTELQNNINLIEWSRFRHTNAYIGDFYWVNVDGKDYHILSCRSYNTVVAFVYMGEFYEVGKYSRTTSKQVTQIYNEFNVRNSYSRHFVPRTR
jgi:hypothetical protein